MSRPWLRTKEEKKEPSSISASGRRISRQQLENDVNRRLRCPLRRRPICRRPEVCGKDQELIDADLRYGGSEFIRSGKLASSRSAHVQLRRRHRHVRLRRVPSHAAQYEGIGKNAERWRQSSYAYSSRT